MWHASIGVRREFRGTMLVPQWTPQELLRAWRLAEHLLRGVGTGPDFRKNGQVSIHLRRSLSDAEIAGLDPAWLAIPAVDLSSADGR